ncbi:solute carrier family 43 member 3-like [Pecten maximus]|uniref:solute carrier family 43 member 3-like n=1 Tax=Pecten maximus TaxID=6579 RepID=UPI0014585FA3|nr:solute carrier family 43 member 3-like [Pecten maximus]
MAISSDRKAAVVLLSLLEVLLFGGLQYGWVSLLYIIKQEKVFENLCFKSNNVTSGNGSLSTSDETCLPQDERFNLVFSIGIAVFTLISALTGHLYYKFGVKKVRALSITVLVAGVISFGFTSQEIPWLVLPGIVFVGVAGLSLLISNMQVAVLLPKASSVYIGLLSGCYDSSVVTQMAVKALYENGISHAYSYMGVAILCVVISGLCTLIHPGLENKSSTSANADDVVKDMGDNVKPIGSINASFNNDEKHLKVLPAETTADKEIVYDNQVSPFASDDIKSPSIGSIICSRLYILHVLWMSALLLRFYYFIGSINRLLEQTLENDRQVSYFTDVMAYTMLGGMASSFIAGQVFQVQNKWFTGTMKTVVPLAVTSCLGILLSSLSFVTSTTVLYADFVVLTFFRSFVYSVNMDFVIISFPQKFMSVLYGLVISVSGMLSLTQYALFTWTTRYEDAMNHVNIFLLCLSVISLLHPILIFTSQKKPPRKQYVDTIIKCSVDSRNKYGHSTKL